MHIAEDLSLTVDDVRLFVDEKLSAKTAGGIFRTMAESRRIKNYRHRLHAIISTLQENNKMPSDFSIINVPAKDSEHEDSAMQLGRLRSAQKGAGCDDNLLGDEMDTEYRPQNPKMKRWQATDVQQEGSVDVRSAANRYKLREMAYFANKTSIREPQGNITSHASSAAQQTTLKQSSRQPQYSKASACQHMTPSSESSDAFTASRLRQNLYTDYLYHPPVVGPRNSGTFLNIGNNNSLSGNISISDSNNQIQEIHCKLLFSFIFFLNAIFFPF
ncbi:hypothetical protein BDZ97DRAFT_1842492 [Flammula alnicola]|nr:hypothetical protein BDZ97DRAFT_1842492 [Flammula alnicola]